MAFWKRKKKPSDLIPRIRASIPSVLRNTHKVLVQHLIEIGGGPMRRQLLSRGAITEQLTAIEAVTFNVLCRHFPYELVAHIFSSSLVSDTLLQILNDTREATSSLALKATDIAARLHDRSRTEYVKAFHANGVSVQKARWVKLAAERICGGNFVEALVLDCYLVSEEYAYDHYPTEVINEADIDWMERVMHLVRNERKVDMPEELPEKDLATVEIIMAMSNAFDIATDGSRIIAEHASIYFSK